MRLRVLASFGIVLGILLVASVAFAGYPDESVGLGDATVWVMNVHESLDANVVASFLAGLRRYRLLEAHRFHRRDRLGGCAHR